MQKWYLVGGDYGPIGAMYIERWILTSSRARAKDIFVDWMKHNHPIEWERMGRSNIGIVREQEA